MIKRICLKTNKRFITLLLLSAILVFTGCVEYQENSKEESQSSDDSVEDEVEAVQVIEEEDQIAQEEDQVAQEDEAMNGSQVSEGYYEETYELTGMQLKRKLNEIITENHGALSYDQVYSALEDTDEDPNDPSKVILFYKGISVPDNELRMSDDGDIWNREHIWAKSHGDFGTKRGPGSDLHMIRPTDSSVNARRGHLDFDESDTVFDEAPGTFVDKDSFEPRDDVKGDVARMLFYMAVRYEGNDGEVDLELSNRTDTFDLTDSGYGEHGKLDTLLEWHILDPVDNFELTRNEVIYQIQGNRNPFIDYPEFVSLIWGESSTAGNQVAENPVIENQEDTSELGILSIDNVRRMSDNSDVTISGTITYQENNTTMYIQDEFAGIRVDSYGSNVDLDDYKLGSKVLLTGELDTYKGEKEIRIDSQANIAVLDSYIIIEPKLVTLIELSDGDYQGQLILTDDVEVVEITNNMIKIQDDDGFVMSIFFGNANNFYSNNIKVGQVYSVTGIASWYNDVQIKLMNGYDMEELN